MIVGETYVWATLGLAIGFVTFVVGGSLLAHFHHRQTTDGEKPFGWPLRFGKWLTERCDVLGLLVNAFLNGAPGVGLIETAMGRPWVRTRRRVWLASLSYAGVWCLIHGLRPAGMVPVHWYPSIDALCRLWMEVKPW
jgi:hypothetical protein